MVIPIIDAHIHLFPKTHLPTLTWYSPEHPLASQHCVEEYREAALSSRAQLDHDVETQLQGFIFVECDRISSVKEGTSGNGWINALDEVSLLGRIISDTPVPGEGHRKADGSLCKGFVAWAPVPGGPQSLERYFDQVRKRTQSELIWKKLCGARYLVQSLPAGVMLHPDFIAGVKWLGKKGFSFDLTVDARSGGLHQLREAHEMLQMVYKNVDSDEQTAIILDHLCKPNLRLQGRPEKVVTEPDFTEWKSLIIAMAKFPKTFMKISGVFSELYPLSTEKEPDYASILETIQPWVDVVFEAFGYERVIYASDWPVCNIGGGGNMVSWSRWKEVVELILGARGCSENEKRSVWGEAAMKAYGLRLPIN